MGRFDRCELVTPGAWLTVTSATRRSTAARRHNDGVAGQKGGGGGTSHPAARRRDGLLTLNTRVTDDRMRHSLSIGSQVSSAAQSIVLPMVIQL